ncbi:MAG: FxsA family protein [Mycobacterium sp.]|jgi:UPF0716 protein FxsA
MSMVMRPLLRYTALYAVVELAAVALLIWAFGLGWTLVVLATTFMAGVLMSAAQVKGQFAAVRGRRVTPQGAMADGVLVGIGSFLVFLPGIVSTAAGSLMLAPPTRTAMRPLAQSMLSRGIGRRIDAVTGAGAAPGTFPAATRRTDYIDGEVIEDAVALTQ